MITRRGLIAGSAGLALLPRLGWAAAPAETLITGATVLTMDGQVLQDADILVRDGTIAAIGGGLEAGSAERIALPGHVVMPGFVDTHWHMWNTLARGLPFSAKGGFAPTMAALSKAWTPKASGLGVKMALAEAVDSGITTVVNWAHNIRSPALAEAELMAMRESGVRGRLAYGYPQDLPISEVMDIADLERLQRAGNTPLVDLGIAARGPERSEPAVWRREWETARRLGLTLTTHIATTAKAAEQKAIASLARDGLLGSDIQLVHAVHATGDDLAAIAKAGSPLIFSPWTELEVGYGIPPITAAAEAGIRIGLSVDNVVLAGRASMFEVMKLTADLAAGRSERQNAVASSDVLRWATHGGATAIGLGERIGTLAPGRQADLIAIRMDGLGLAPAGHLDMALTHMARPSDVSLVMIDGVIHKRDGRLTRVDTATLIPEAMAEIARIRREAGV